MRNGKPTTLSVKGSKLIVKFADTVSDEQVELLNSMLCATKLQVNREGRTVTLASSSERLVSDLQVVSQALRFSNVEYSLRT